MFARAAGAALACVVALTSCGAPSPVADRAAAPDCGARTGTLVEHTVDALDTKASSVVVYLPACYGDGDAVYPTLWLMHGGLTTADMWTNHPVNAVEVFDDAIASGEVSPVIVAMPNGATGRPEFTATEFDLVLASVDEAFRTIDAPAARAVAGVSAGGVTAASLAAENASTQFAALGLFMTAWGASLDERFPAGFAGDEVQPRVLVDIGADDGLRSYDDDIDAAIDAAGLEAEFLVHEGRHDRVFVASRFPDWFRWLAAQLP